MTQTTKLYQRNLFGLPIWLWPFPIGYCAMNIAIGQWWVAVAFIPVLGFCVWNGKTDVFKN